MSDKENIKFPCILAAQQNEYVFEANKELTDLEDTSISDSLKHIFEKFVARNQVKNINTFKNVLQAIFLNKVVKGCFNNFRRCLSLSRNHQLHKTCVEPQEKNATSVCGTLSEFLQYLELNEETLIKENSWLLKSWVKSFNNFEGPDERFVNIIKEICEMCETNESMSSENKEVNNAYRIAKFAYDVASIKYYKRPCELALAILNINLTPSKGDILILVTRTLWDLVKKRKSQTHQNTMQTEPQHKTILYRCICILRNAKKQAQFSDVNITNYTNAFELNEQSLENENEAGKKSNTEIALIIMFLLLVAATRHHKSAELKKYLSQKYVYKEAILYILWCSGDIHINPGPPMKKSQLLHDSQRERAWMQVISSILLKLYKGESPHSKPKNLWREKPEHWPQNKPFYDTKNHAHDEYGCSISEAELLKCLIHCCDRKKVNINNMYKKEITAWTKNKSQLLHKLHIFRTETEKIKNLLQNILIYKDTDELKEALNNINVKLSLKDGDSDLKNIQFKRIKNRIEMFADITRFLAAVICKIIKGKNPELKCDGLWTDPPEPWPADIPFFSPFNRGKCNDTCSDQLLLSTLLQHPKAVIPPKYKSLVESYQNVVNSTDKKEAKTHKEVLCRVKTIQTDVSVLDYALTYLHREGFFTSEIYYPLHQWWAHENVENQTEITFANLHTIFEDRPRIFIEVTRECMKLSVMQSTMDYKTKSEVCYSISLDDSLHTPLDSNSQHCSDVDQLCNNDNLQGTSVKKNSQIPHKQKSSSDAASLNEYVKGIDTTQYSLINNDNETDSLTKNEILFSRHKLLRVESNSLPLSDLKKSKENATSTTLRSTSKTKEILARDSRQTNCTTDVSGINTHHTSQCDNNQRAIVPETNESEVFIEKQSKGKKRKLSIENNENGMNKPMLIENNTKNDFGNIITKAETVSDHQFVIDFLSENCIDGTSFQHDKSTSESSSLGSAEDERMDFSLPVSSDNYEVSDGLESLITDFINYESGKTSRLEKDLLLYSL